VRYISKGGRIPSGRLGVSAESFSMSSVLLFLFAALCFLYAFGLKTFSLDNPTVVNSRIFVAMLRYGYARSFDELRHA
jgi:hypothetical protein